MRLKKIPVLLIIITLVTLFSVYVNAMATEGNSNIDHEVLVSEICAGGI